MNVAAGFILISIALTVVLYFWFSWDSFEFEDDLSYWHWRKLDAIDAILDCTDRMAQDLRDYADDSEDAQTDFANPTLGLLDEYDTLKKEISVCRDAGV